MLNKLILIACISLGLLTATSVVVAHQVFSPMYNVSPYSNCEAGWCDYKRTERTAEGTLIQTTNRVWVGQ